MLFPNQPHLHKATTVLILMYHLVLPILSLFINRIITVSYVSGFFCSASCLEIIHVIEGTVCFYCYIFHCMIVEKIIHILC